MKKRSIALLLAGLLQLPLVHAASAPIAVIAYAEKPLKLIRATTLYTIGPGTRLQGGDILQTGAAGIQIEGLAAANLALGPDTRILIATHNKDTQINLLNGWLKLQPVAGNGHANLAVTTGGLGFTLTNSASVIHVGKRQTEIFVEDGSQVVSELDAHGKTDHSVTLDHEDFAQRVGDAQLKIVPRPEQAFIDALPPQFLDPLVPLGKKTPKAPEPVKERDVTYEDIAPWVVSPLNLNQQMLASRFAPRLNDPAFLQAVKVNRGGVLAWELELLRLERRKNAR
ncbi:hypothetical protein HX787_22860 [Pseudomonas tolaasii]|uniref:FecR domain-containing protein n=2 Tax=Pseudomonas tolaasii TaxID=29442 RepID=A0A7Y8AR05_PSETO|nr:hypothetical protein [Pseudomonas tolaasii]ARB28560.1 hypothetical protein B5P22_15125 [Pseudomonas tolaasii]KAB0465027.1 hypothetical protein F7R12_30635 [Pseudomonas tolaasii]MBW1249445.1 hypothetical protein [Pseudomonas tolaasii]MBW4791248.1 hypothetical protein [Pseudomonas tolaasii]MBY8943892.1 hypothetical protein [Pseudomonas tolaasii]